MKKRKLNFLKLNKRNISLLQVNGGQKPRSFYYSNCEACDTPEKTRIGCHIDGTHSGETYYGGACTDCDVNTHYQC